MFRKSAFQHLFSKPIGEAGYVAQLPACAAPRRGPLWRRAQNQNSDVKQFYTPDATRYEEWYKETYGLENIRDGCAASGVSSNRILDDSKVLQDIQQYDFEAIDKELLDWSFEFHHNNQLH